MDKNKIILIDGNSLLYRAYYATSYGVMMQSKSGVYTNAILALSNMISKIIEQEKPKHIMVAFDSDKPSFRKQEAAFYKANRQKAPEELVMQFPLAREMIKLMGIKLLEIPGYEADDIIGTMSKIASRKDYQVKIFSSDRDLLQLIDKDVNVCLLKKGLSEIENVGLKELKENYQLTPKQVIDFKALSGDASDNIPGVKGIGEKTALKLLEDYDDLDNIYLNIDNLKGKLKDNLIEEKQIAYLSRQLATLITNIELDCELSDCVYEGYLDELFDFYQKYDLNSLIKKLDVRVEKKVDYQLDNLVSSDFFEKKVFIYPYYDSDNYHLNDLKYLSLSNGVKTHVLSLDFIKSNVLIKGYLSNEKSEKIIYDYKALYFLLKKIGINIFGKIHDFKLIHYLLKSHIKSEEEFIFASLDEPLFSKREDSITYSAQIALNMSKTFEKMYQTLIKEEMVNLYEQIELPLIKSLINMEEKGFKIDVDVLKKLSIAYSDKIEKLSQTIYEVIGKEFNINSPKQVGEILFDELELPTDKKRSTNIEVLERLAKFHPIVPLIIEHRKYAKLLSTYIDGLLSHVNEDGKIYTIFNQMLTQTGRLSTSEPNLQNISTRDEESREIRKAFVCEEKDNFLLSIDYSQMELRILASLSGDQSMIKAFEEEKDIHTSTAALVFNVNQEDVNFELRRKAKAINFGIIYGMSDWGLANQINVYPSEAKEFIEKYFITFPDVKKYLDNQVDICTKTLEVRTLYNRKRTVNEINNKNYQVREFGKRIAMNSPIQGSASDIIKIAMVNVTRYLEENNLKTKMLLQVHDELIFEVCSDEKEKVIKDIKQIMENSVKLKVNLQTSYNLGRTWFDLT